MYHALYFPLCVYSLNFLFFSLNVLYYQSHSKTNGVNQEILLCFVKGWPSIKLNVQTAPAESEEQDTLSNIIFIQFQKCDFFHWGLLWSRGSLDVDKLPEKYQWWVSLFLAVTDWVSASLPKFYSLASTFQGFCSDLLLSIKISQYFRKFCFPEKPFGCGC